MPRRARWIRIARSATPRTQGQNVPTTYHAPRIERLNTINTTKARANRLARYTRFCARLRNTQNNSTLGQSKHSAIAPAVDTSSSTFFSIHPSRPSGLEDRKRIERGAHTLLDPQRRGREHELVAVQPP